MADKERKYRNPADFKKGTLVLLMIGTILATFGLINDLIVTPAANAFIECYGIGAANYVLSGPSLIMIVAAPITGILMRYLSNKTILCTGFGFITVGGCLLSVLYDSAVAAIILRTIIGLGMGTISTTCVSLIAEAFVDDNARGSMMGIWNAGMAVIGMVLGAVSGMFAADTWYTVFKLYWVAVPILIVLLFAIPRTAPEKEQVDEGADASLNGPMPWKRVVLWNLLYFVFCMVLNAFYYQNAVYVLETQIGTEALAGIVGSCISGGTLVSCLIFGPLYAKTKNYLVFESFILMLVAYALFAFIPSATCCLVGAAILGLANGLILSHLPSILTEIVPPNQTSFCLSLNMATLGISQFCSTYFATFIASLSPAGSFMLFCQVAFGISLVGTALSLVYGIAKSKKSKATTEA